VACASVVPLDLQLFVTQASSVQSTAQIRIAWQVALVAPPVPPVAPLSLELLVLEHPSPKVKMVTIAAATAVSTPRMAI
jgi:hypothetical protein